MYFTDSSITRATRITLQSAIITLALIFISLPFSAAYGADSSEEPIEITPSATDMPVETNSPTQSTFLTQTPEPTSATEPTRIDTPTPEQTATPEVTATPVITEQPTITPTTPVETLTPTSIPTIPIETTTPGPTATPGPGPTATPGTPVTPTLDIERALPAALNEIDTENPVMRGIKYSYGNKSYSVPAKSGGSYPKTGYVEQPNNKLLAKAPSDNTYVQGSSIIIPSLNIHLPLAQASSLNTELLVGDREAVKTSYRGITLIYGHNTTDTFGDLNRMELGESVILRDSADSTIYTVTSKRSVWSGSLASLDEFSSGTVVLSSCDANNTALRIIIELHALATTSLL